MLDSEINFEVLKMHFNTIKEIKLELKRIRKRQDTHKFNRKMVHRKGALRVKLWKLIREEPRGVTTSKSSRPARARAESENIRKTKRSGQYT